MTTELEVLKIINFLGAAYPTVTPAKETIAVYVELLADLPSDYLMTAVREHIGRSHFYPTVAELRQAALDIQLAAQPLPDAYMAWAEVQREIKRVGHKGEPTFSHPLIVEVVGLFGWRYLCLSENGMSDRSHFIQAYKPRQEHANNEVRQLPATRSFIQTLSSGAALFPELPEC